MKNIRLRTKLLIIVLVSIVPMILLNSYMMIVQSDRAIDLELKANQEYAQTVGLAFTNYLEEIWNAELIISKYILDNPTLETEHFNQYLTSCLEGYNSIRSFTWVEPDGTFKYSTNPKGIGTTLQVYKFYDRIVDGEEKVISDLVIGKTSKIPSIAIARGIRENGELKGIIFAAITADSLDLVMPNKRLGKTSSFGLVDRNGVFVYRHGSPKIPNINLRLKDDSPVRKVLEGEVVLLKNYRSSIDNVSRVSANVPITEIGWLAFASTQTDEVLANAYDQAKSNILMILLTAVISLGVALYFILELLKPIKTIENAANAISRSDFSVRTNLQRRDELGQTGMAFDKMAKHIQELEQSRMLFLQTASHELRNPMTSVKGLSSLIHYRVNSGKSPDSIVELSEALHSEVTRLAGLLNQILDAFTAERQNVKIHSNLQRLNLAEVISSAIKLYQMEPTHSRKIINKNQTSIWVSGDHHRLEDVIRNLISNAIKYSPEMSEVTIDTAIGNGFAVISVSDEGSGIPDDEITQIFNSFHRVNHEENDPGGLGLGLYICKDIILKHGGSIWAENNQDKGSTFYIKLPLYKS